VLDRCIELDPVKGALRGAHFRPDGLFDLGSVTFEGGMKLAKAPGPKVVVAPPGLFVERHPCRRYGIFHIPAAGVGADADDLLCDRTHVIEDLAALC
jgi:hypothetical protein